MKGVIFDKKSALCIALVSMVLYFSFTPVLWAQSKSINSSKVSPERASVFKGEVHTFFSLTENGTGFVPMLKAWIAKTVPLNVAGSLYTTAQQSTYMLALKHVLLVSTVEHHPQFTHGEQRVLLEKLAVIAPSFFSSRRSYIYKLVALDHVLEGMEAETRTLINTPKIGTAMHQALYAKSYEISHMRSELGVAERKINNNEEWFRAAPGHWLVFDPHQKIYVYAQKLGPAK